MSIGTRESSLQQAAPFPPQTRILRQQRKIGPFALLSVNAPQKNNHIPRPGGTRAERHKHGKRYHRII
nr:MAG TPA: hypothetical protein [Caudoviricetes sp.]